jgi:hypothetical protein
VALKKSAAAFAVRLRKSPFEPKRMPLLGKEKRMVSIQIKGGTLRAADTLCRT